MKVNGKVFFGVNRGKGVIDKYHARLVGLLGFRPYKGTLNVRVGKSVDIKPHSTRTISHKISDGSTMVEAYLAPMRINVEKEKRRLKGITLEGDETVSTYKWKKRDAFSLRRKGKFVTWGVIETEEERKIVDELKRLENVPNEERMSTSPIKCWAIQLTSGARENNVLEIISQHRITDTLDIQDGSEIEIEFVK